MPNKKTVSSRLENTLNELDTALNQWNSLTNKPTGEQVEQETELQKKAKVLLKELRDQIEGFEDEPEEQSGDLNSLD